MAELETMTVKIEAKGDVLDAMREIQAAMVMLSERLDKLETEIAWMQHDAPRREKIHEGLY